MDDSVVSSFLQLAKNLLRVGETSDGKYKFKKEKKEKKKKKNNNLDDIDNQNLDFLQFTFNKDSESRKLELSRTTIVEIYKFIVFSSTSYFYESNIFNFQYLRLIILEFITNRLHRWKCLEELFRQIVKNENWNKCLKYVFSHKPDESDKSDKCDKSGRCPNFWYCYFFKFIITVLDDNEINEFLQLSRMNEFIGDDSNKEEEMIKFQIDVSLVDILQVFEIQGSGEEKLFYVVKDNDCDYDYLFRQIYLIGRFFEPYICDLKLEIENFDYSEYDDYDYPSEEKLNCEFKKSFNQGRLEMMKEKQHKISTLTQLLNSLNFSVEKVVERFLIPEINFIIAHFC